MFPGLGCSAGPNITVVLQHYSGLWQTHLGYQRLVQLLDDCECDGRLLYNRRSLEQDLFRDNPASIHRWLDAPPRLVRHHYRQSLSGSQWYLHLRPVLAHQPPLGRDSQRHMLAGIYHCPVQLVFIGYVVSRPVNFSLPFKESLINTHHPSLVWGYGHRPSYGPVVDYQSACIEQKGKAGRACCNVYGYLVRTDCHGLVSDLSQGLISTAQCRHCVHRQNDHVVGHQ
jgi:hypothetical protein